MDPSKIPPEVAAENFGPRIIAANIVVTVLAGVAVALRVVARKFTKQPLLWDDWLVFIALPFGIGECIAACIAATHGMGRHIFTLTPEEIPVYSKAFVATQIIWGLSLPFVKTSILFLYVRIFGRLKYFRRIAWVVGVINFAYGIMVALVCALQCIPLESLWNPMITDKTCINSGIFFIVGSIPDFTIDIFTLLLPIPAVWSLNTTRAKKLIIIGVFMLGSFTCVVSLIRFSELCIYGTNPDVTYALGNLGIWSTVELNIGIVAACLPTLWPLITKVFPRLRGNASSAPLKYTPGGNDLESSKKKSKASKYGYTLSALDSTNGTTGGKYEEMDDDTPFARSTVQNNIQGPGGRGNMPANGGIRVDTRYTTEYSQ